MENKQNSNQEDLSNRSLSGGDHESDIAGSPSSHSNSSASRHGLGRVIELLRDRERRMQEDGPGDWVIRQEFYDEDVAENSANLLEISDDENDEHYNLDDIDILTDIDIDQDDDDEEEEEDDDEEIEEDDVDIDVDDEMDPDFVIAPDEDIQSSSEDTEEDEEDENAGANRRINYDTSLPVNHPYLGQDLEESRGRQVLVENSSVVLPLFNLNQVVLFPGQVLPITTSNLNYRMKSYLEACVNRGWLTIGLMCDPHVNRIGTTAEIRNYSEVDGVLQLTLILEGRQRFQLLSEPFDIVIEGLIRILPEITLGKPYPRISSLSRFLTQNETPNKFIISKHPHWILKKYEATNVMRRILSHIKDWCSVDMTKNPSDFSYWVSSNLPISNKERMKALSFSCTEERLLWLLGKLENSEAFVCSACKNVICYKKDVFPMSRSGPQCSFVNTGGYIHDTLTVMSAKGLIQERRWSAEFSWFPGYAWRMAHCDNCNRHIGWCYKRLEQDIKPKRFFGLSRSNVRLHSVHEPTAWNLPTDELGIGLDVNDRRPWIRDFMGLEENENENELIW